MINEAPRQSGQPVAVSDDADTPSLLLSVVVPLYNERDNLTPLLEQLLEALEPFAGRYEIIFVDDGSSDGSYEFLRERAASLPQLRLARFARNYGQTAALSAGFHMARAEAVVTLDGDLQNDPHDIPALLEQMDAGFDIVSGWRKNRRDTFINRTLPSRVANWLISRITGVHLHDYGCTLKAYRRTVLSRFELYGQLHRFLPALGAWAGGSVTEIVVNHRARERGTTSYGIGRTFTVLLDLATVKFLMSYGAHPIRVFGMIGMGSAFAGLLALGGTIAMKVMQGIDMTGNPLLYLSMMGALLGVQFLLMGIIAEMLMRTYHEAQGKRPYVIVDRVN